MGEVRRRGEAKVMTYSSKPSNHLPTFGHAWHQSTANHIPSSLTAPGDCMGEVGERGEAMSLPNDVPLKRVAMRGSPEGVGKV
jgi:hypothetical protein